MRLTIVQYAGDYREAFDRFTAGGKATYHAQRYSVDFVESLAQRLDQVAVVCAVSDEAYDVVLPNGVRAIGAGFEHGFRERQLVDVVAATRPDRLILTTPNIPLLRWARKNRVRAITQLADSFQNAGVKQFLRHSLLAYYLNRVEWAGNHSVGASLSLTEIGVKPDKVIPWDWPRLWRPYDYAPRALRRKGPFKLVYVGANSEEKGVGDLLRALALLDNVSLTIIGRPQEQFQTMARGFKVTFTGLLPNEHVPGAMRDGDAVVVPSRHEYPEGLPGTLYQALATRTPLIASDHPMFRGAITHEESALIFPATDEHALAATVRRLANDAELYAALSRNSLAAWEALQLPVQWGQLMEKWLSDQQDWLFEHRLASGLYDRQIRSRHA